MQALLDALSLSLALRPPLHPFEVGRIFHGRGGLHPGCEHWALDLYPPVWLLTSFRPVEPHELLAIGEVLRRRVAEIAPDAPLCWVYQCRQGAGRTDTRLMAGSVPEPHLVQEGPARYLVHLLRGQNHGLFLDMAEGRRWVREHVAARPGARVLNLFAYTCAFSVVALQAGAGQVVNIDMSRSALATGRRNHELNGVFGPSACFLDHDIFSSWAKITRMGPYDLIVADPPSYQKGSFIAEKDYPRLMRRLPGLLAPGGHALLCLNSPELGSRFLTEHMATAAPEWVFQQRLPNPTAFADRDEERSLKALVYEHTQDPGAQTRQPTGASPE